LDIFVAAVTPHRGPELEPSGPRAPVL
jgi:hypothetical protein